MATLTPVATRDDTGVGIADIVALLANAADLQNDFVNDGNNVLFVNNGSASPLVVTLIAEPDPFGRGGGGVGDEAITIPAGKLGMFPFASPAMFNSGAKAAFTLDATATIKIGIVKIKKNR